MIKLSSGGQLPIEDRELLRGLCDDVRTFDARRDIIREGERPDGVHLMIEGWACRYKVLVNGTRQITAFLLPGNFCDTLTLFDRMDHGIGSLTKSRVALIPHAKIREIVQRPGVARAFWWAGLVDEAVLREWIVNVGRRDALQRVGHLICELHARLRHVGLVHEGKFQFPLTQEELGDALGLTSVHINRTLKKLREKELVAIVHRQLAILDVAGLQRLVGFDANYLHLTQPS